MSIYVLDTDAISRQQRGNELFVRRLATIPATNVFTTVITLREQLRGRLTAVDQAEEQMVLIDAYTRLQTTLDYFRQINILPFTSGALTRLQQ